MSRLRAKLRALSTSVWGIMPIAVVLQLAWKLSFLSVIVHLDSNVSIYTLLLNLNHFPLQGVIKGQTSDKGNADVNDSNPRGNQQYVDVFLSGTNIPDYGG